MVLSPPEWVFQWSQVVSGLGSIVLTVFLVILYKRQQDQLAADHKALLEVSDVEWDRDEATLKISNFGNGVATKLSIVTLAHVESGEHRSYSSRRHHLKRQDKEGQWANTIQPGEEDVEFVGKSTIGNMTPDSSSRDWYGINFSFFINQMKRKNVEEVKFMHIVRGTELSNSPCFVAVEKGTKSINPQEFGREHSLENLPGVTVYGSDETFLPYFRRDTLSQIRPWIYHNGVRLLNVLPGINIRRRVLDASGTKPVKRVILRRNIKERLKSIKHSGDNG